MDRKVEIISRNEAFKQAIFRIEEARFRFERYDGAMSGEVVRLNLDRGDSVAAVVHDRTDDTLILTEQFRYPTYEKGPGWIIELPAGVLDDREDPENAMKREIMEETGYAVTSIAPIGSFYVSPGGTSERIHLYYTTVRPASKQGPGKGIAAEGEDIRVITMTVAEALERLHDGNVADAKTIIGLQWLELRRAAHEGRCHADR